VLGRSLGRPDWVVLGMGGALLHVWNHSLFKPLLFFGAGAVIHAAHTRDIDRLGGLARAMPRVTALFLAGAVAICALPPMNGFAGEWLLYVGLFRTLAPAGGPGAPVAAMAAVALAMIGALAVACFVKLFGTVFLGTARGDSTRHAHDPSASMLVPMAVLAAAAACLGLFPVIAAPWLEDAATAWARLPGAGVSIAAVAPLRWITVLGLGLAVLAATIALILRGVPRAHRIGGADTWGCGYARPTARMQYTGSSFGQTLVGLFPFLLRPARQIPDLRGAFPAAGRFSSVLPDTILDRVVIPLFGVAGRHLPRLRVLQQGQTQIYVLYILIVLVVLLAWGALGVHP
jgi:hydrogenase-4 component B